ncbi:Nif3-like dinuclear metal center hexameric protein [Aquibacillus halophilus]|uniref:GTP cyclohydrolase 1 type 2 homolog n=1 Tax=Aquibacillus halophilus TaxID=930132 RepID=A0A6A8DCX1_9BACI|nr:Nif3-like dinuclear metal center hexameric protein [Aquibacillus halophilus]MRH43100.1 Nif3-like dinuclear metal center hexameric protein [Aquibacillus halophilus]
MTKTTKVQDIVNIFESWVPKKLAYDWDNVGIQVGSLQQSVKKVMVTLDVLENVVDEAIEQKVDLIIAHHPLLFKSLKQINLDQTSGRIIEKLIKNDITVYAAHTNLDIVSGGVNDILTDKLSISNTEVLVEDELEKLYKLIVYVPKESSEQLKDALGNAGAGHIGLYSHCMFTTDGEGSFKPLEGSKPFLGSQGVVERVDEVKVETIIAHSKLSEVLSAMQDNHPYEEVAYDLIPLANKGKPIGAGRIGSLISEITLREFCENIKSVLEIPSLRVTGDLNQKVKRIAVLGGSGKAFIEHAKRKGADVYITGDMTFHEAQDAWQMGLNVVDPGHYIEKVMKQAVKSFLDSKCENAGIEVVISREITDPFQFL